MTKVSVLNGPEKGRSFKLRERTTSILHRSDQISCKKFFACGI